MIVIIIKATVVALLIATPGVAILNRGPAVWPVSAGLIVLGLLSGIALGRWGLGDYLDGSILLDRSGRMIMFRWYGLLRRRRAVLPLEHLRLAVSRTTDGQTVDYRR